MYTFYRRETQRGGSYDINVFNKLYIREINNAKIKVDNFFGG